MRDASRSTIDFRIVHVGDVVARRQAPNVDSECTGTMLRDFLRASDLQRIDEQVAVDYERTPVSRP